MPKTYADWLKAEQTNINPSAPAIVSRPATTVGNNPSYADLMLRNEQIRNSPEVTKGGYSNLDPNATVQNVSVPQLASDTPDWAKRTPTEQARVNAAQAAANAQGYDALAPATTTETVPNTDAGSPSTDENEPTGYAKYLAQHPEYAEDDRRAEAEYARSLPTYGALAERMAQAGIHGGYSDYLQGVAYAKMQNAKQQNEEAARKGYADYLKGGTGENNALYSLLTEGSYTDADGNTVQGYNLLDMTDEQFNAVKPTITSILTESGKYTPAQIEEAFAGVERTRETMVDSTKTQASDLLTRYGNKTATEDEVLTAFGFDPESVEDKPEAIRFAIESAYKDNLIDQPQASATITRNLPMYEEGFDKKSWKETGADIYNSVSTAIDDAKSGIVTKEDLDAVINDAMNKMGVSTVSMDYNPTWDGHPNLELTLKDGTKLKADYNGKASDTVSTFLSNTYGNLPLVVYNDTLYYQVPTEYENSSAHKVDPNEPYKVVWYELKTKKGSSGTPEQGDAYFSTVAKIMMANNNAEKMGNVLVSQSKNNRVRTWDIKTGKITYSKK